MINAWIMGILIKNASKENMKLLASKFNEKKFFLRSQLYARAYVRIWTLRPWPWSIFLCHSHCFETYGAVFIMNSKIHLRKNSSNEYFKTISHYLRVYSLSGFTVGRSINGLVFFFAAFAEVQVTVLSVLNLPRQGFPATCPVRHCCVCNPWLFASEIFCDLPTYNKQRMNKMSPSLYTCCLETQNARWRHVEWRL